MIIGLSIYNFTLLHVAITLVAIASGLIVLFGMLGAHRMPGWTALFLATTILTSVTGFMFPIQGFTPASGCRRGIAGHPRDRAAGALRQAPCRSLALDLCCHRGHRALVQRVRADCADVPKDLDPPDPGADPVRAALPDRPGRRARRTSSCSASWRRGGSVRPRFRFSQADRAPGPQYDPQKRKKPPSPAASTKLNDLGDDYLSWFEM